MNSEQRFLKPDSSSVMKHIDMYQNIISRMAGNSVTCKQWAIGLASAILVLVAEKGKIEFALLVIIPITLFCFLDAYYLALEKQFRNAYTLFIQELHKGKLQENQLYLIKTDGKLPKTFITALGSWAILPFYLGMLGLIAVAVRIVIY